MAKAARRKRNARPKGAGYATGRPKSAEALAKEAAQALVPTAATHRQIIPTGTLTEIGRFQPPVPEVEADDLDIAKHHHQFTDAHVQSAIAFIKRTGIVKFLDDRHKKDKDPRGRKAEVPTLAVLVALWIIACDGGNMWLVNVRDLLFHKISDESRTRLGITFETRPTRPEDQPRNDPSSKADRKWDTNSEKAVGRAFHRMLASVDPSIHPKGRILPWALLSEKSRKFTVEQQQERQTALDWVCNRLLQTAFMHLPRRIRRKYRGSACIDGTPMPLWSVGRGKDKPECSSDPDGGYYGRQDTHGEPGDISKAMWAFDVHLIVVVDDHHGNRQWLPALPLTMTLDRPGFDPSGAARRMFDFIRKAKYPTRWLAGDLLYTHQKPENFQDAAREIHYKPVLGYGPQHHGKQGTHASGIGLVEGAYYCPAMPLPLVDATVLRRSKDMAEKLTHEQYREAIDARETYLMRTKQKPDDNGRGERLGCPASGANPTAVCELKPASANERKTRQPNGSIADARPTIHPPLHVIDAHHDVCAKDSVTLAPGDGAQYRQELRYATIQHITQYVRLRQSQEGLHGFTKKQAATAFDDPNARRVRGKAANSLFAALLLAAASIAKIRSFLANAETEPQTGDRYVNREPVASALSTPPGAEPPDLPPEELPAAA
jgi:hypothetical protein